MEIFRALGALVEPPSEALTPVARVLGIGPLPDPSTHTDLFEFQLYPYASVYLNADGMLGGAARDRIAGFLRALGVEPPKEPDHVTYLLACYASLVDAAADEDASEAASQGAAQQARSAFLHEHLLSWIPPYLRALDRLSSNSPFYNAWGRLLDTALIEQHAHVEIFEQPALHLRRAPDLADPRDDGMDGFIAGLLSPAVSGVVIVRDDLARCARALELGLRKGERRFVLRALLTQDSPGVLEWLAIEAHRQGESHRESDACGRHWRARAAATGRLLEALATRAQVINE